MQDRGVLVAAGRKGGRVGVRAPSSLSPPTFRVARPLDIILECHTRRVGLDGVSSLAAPIRVPISLIPSCLSRQVTVLDLQSRLDQATKSGSVSAAGSNDILLTLGGKDVDSHTNAGSLYRGSGAWAERKPLPEPRSDMAAVLVECNPCALPGGGAVNGSRILVLGGLGTENNVSSSVLMYDPLLDEFTQLAPMPVPRFRFGAAVVGEEVYVVGGFDAGTDDAQPLLVSQVSLSFRPSASCLALSNQRIFLAASPLVSF